MQVEREKALEHKQRMSRMMEDKENFLSKITAARSFIYEVRPFCEFRLRTDVTGLELMLFFPLFKEKLKAFQERLVEERKKRLEDRKRQRKEDRRNAYHRQKEEEAQRIHEEQLKRGNHPRNGGILYIRNDSTSLLDANYGCQQKAAAA